MEQEIVAQNQEAETEFAGEINVPDEELTLLQKVLLNKVEFNDGQYISDVEGIYDDEFEREVNFYVVDLDRDGKIEVCIEYASGSVLILHDSEEKVYGYDVSYRAFHPVYKDGTFEGSGGASLNTFYGNVRFDEKMFYFDVITSISYDEATSYYKNGEAQQAGSLEISKDEYDEIMTAYLKEPVEVYEFSIENILKYVND